MKWATLRDFELHYHQIIQRTIQLAAPLIHQGAISDLSCQLWSKVRRTAGRSPAGLCFDCCYIILRMSGLRVSVRELEEIAFGIMKRPVSVWSFHQATVWWKEPEAMRIILNICGNGNPEAVLPLYKELFGVWPDEEE